MDLRTLREYAEAKGFWITTGLALIGIVVSLATAKGLLWISAAVALGFMGLYPIVNMRNRWDLYSRGERWFNVGLNGVFSVYLIYIIVSGLESKGAEKLSIAFGMGGVSVVLILFFFLLCHWIPLWGRGRKKCPDCLTATDVTAKACAGCGYHWPAEPIVEPEQGSAAA